MSALLAATRPTRRDIVRHPWRILAAVLLIALPVFAGTWLWTNTHAEDRAARIAQPRTEVQVSGSFCVQNVDASAVECEYADPGDDHALLPLLQAHLPEGSSVQMRFSTWGHATLGNARSYLAIEQMVGGRVPPPGQIWLSTSDARNLQAEVGDTISFAPQGHPEALEFTVAGTMPGFASLVAEPTIIEPAAVRTDTDTLGTASWTVSTPEEFTWDDVLALNEVGFTVRSQDVIDNPPPPEALPEQFREVPDSSAAPLNDWSINVVVGAALLLVGALLLLVISPVFTIATSRMSRDFALMSSQGATPWHIRLAVLAYGLFSGLIGATLGAALGVGGTAVAWFLKFPDWPLSIPWLGVLALWATAVVGSTCASLLPAVVASRASISAGVQGSSPDRLLAWRPWMAVGPIGLLLLAASVLTLRFMVRPEVLLFWAMVPALLLVLLLAASAPAIAWGLGRLGTRAPLPLRLSLRDVGRQSLRSVPALAAIMAVLAIAVGAQAFQSASEARTQALYASVYREPSILVAPALEPVAAPDPASIDDVARTVEEIAGPSVRTDLYGVRFHSDRPGFPEVNYRMDECHVDDPSERCLPLLRRDHVSGPLELSGGALVEASPEILELVELDDAARARAEAALGQPGILVSEGTLDSELQVRELEYDPSLAETRILNEVTAPTIPVLPELAATPLLTPSALADLGIPVEYLGTVFTPREPLSYRAGLELQARVDEQTVDTSVSISPYPTSGEWWPAAFAGVLGAGVVIVLTLVLALSWQGSRRQFALLDAVGAPPSLPSQVSGAFAGILALVGSLAGVAAGYLAAWMVSPRTIAHPSGAVLETGSAAYLSADWPVLLILLVITPAVAWAIGSLFHRQLGEQEYRQT
ncbi:FtsX-like permease family protein [Corynebacterium sp.]|uniref:FtsX-like permease family protein n=1 Tax=Corynebacterium sp. TaxID=1720 RepID=UPI0026DECAC4|nr:FtsX-like permease family protein [Corynebacterium sp.]MDO5513029.1 hypothetical protein [Corynebacterium sp.]